MNINKNLIKAYHKKYLSRILYILFLALSGCYGGIGLTNNNGTIGNDNGNNLIGSINPNRSDNIAAFRPVHELTEKHCSSCHSENVTVIDASPKHAHSDTEISLIQTSNEGLININKPEQSRLYQKLLLKHNCWSDCTNNANEMLAMINEFIAQATLDSDNSLKLSSLPRTLLATNQSFDNVINDAIALYRFEEGSGTTAHDTSGVAPSLDLKLMNDVSWVSGGGLYFSGIAEEIALSSSMPASDKLYNRIATEQGSRAYSVETWIIPDQNAQNSTLSHIWGYSDSHDNINAAVAINENMIAAKFRSEFEAAGDITSTDVKIALSQPIHIITTYNEQGSQIYVNGNLAGNGPYLGFMEWRDSAKISIGSMPGEEFSFKGEIKYLAIYDKAINQSQALANYQQSASEYIQKLERQPIKFDVSQLVGITNSYIEIEVSDYDKDSYLFIAPTLHLGQADNFTIKGLRIAVNGTVQVAAQAFAKIDTQINGKKQQLSSVGTVIRKQDGPNKDIITLVFEEIAGKQNVVVEPESKSVITFKQSRSTEVGIPLFSAAYYDLSTKMNINPQNPNMLQLYNELKTQLPNSQDAMSLNASIQTALNKLSAGFCNELMRSRNNYRTFFQTIRPSVSNNRDRAVVYNALYNHFLLGGEKQISLEELTSELNTLVTQLNSLNLGNRQIIQATCTAVAASAASYLLD